MSAIAAVVGGARGAPALDRARAAIAAMEPAAAAATSAAALRHGMHTVALAAVAADWERALRPGAGIVASRGPFTVAADATLYHRADLRRALGVPDDDRLTDAALALDTYARWGEAGLERLEGDFAFVVWDASSGRLLAARSFSGHRPLHFAEGAFGLRLASTVQGVLADADVPRDLDHGSIAAVAAGLWAHHPGTAYQAIRELAPGMVLRWEPGRRATVRRWWRPPGAIAQEPLPLDAGAEELRALLVDAVRERLAPMGDTALSLSGGWDSTSVGGAATVALRDGRGRGLRPVSISYPEGDPGREDELIAAVAAHWGIAPTWIPVDDIALLPAPEADAATRDLPFAHAFAEWNRALGRTARAQGARVMLDGVGGDSLFQVSDIVLSDLFGALRWRALAEQWRLRGGAGAGNLWRWAVRPALPRAVPRAIAWVRRRPAPPAHHLHRAAPWWMDGDFLTREAVLAREAAAEPALPRGSRVLAETHAYLTFPFFGRVMSHLRAFAWGEGVELRSPLLDDRVVRFAVGRPWQERSDGRETKILLRRAMRGLVPDAVLAPRPHRTGITSAYFLRQLRGPARAAIDAALTDPLLARLGMLDAAALRKAWAHVLAHDDDELGARVFFTVQAEWWTRAHRAPEVR